MRILIIGATGTIGKVVADHFKANHEVLTASRTSGDVIVDITNRTSITSMMETIRRVDAMICIAGEAKWAAFDQLTEEDFYTGLRSKLMGQVNLVQIAMQYLNENGSITLSSGILADQPVMSTTSAAMVNGALHSFVKAAALEMEHGIRVNVVSSGVVEDAYDKYKDYFLGHSPIPMKKVVAAYAQSVEGKGSGEVIKIYNP